MQKLLIGKGITKVSEYDLETVCGGMDGGKSKPTGGSTWNWGDFLNGMSLVRRDGTDVFDPERTAGGVVTLGISFALGCLLGYGIAFRKAIFEWVSGKFKSDKTSKDELTK